MSLHVAMSLAGVTEKDSAPAAARKLTKYWGQTAGIDGLTQKIRRHRRSGVGTSAKELLSTRTSEPPLLV